MLYFAYCTFLDSELVKKDFPDARPVVKASLHGYRLTFVHFESAAKAGVCHLEVALDEEVLGMLWEMDEPFTSRVYPGYRIAVFRVQGEDGNLHNAWTRIVEDPLGSMKPAQGYFANVLKGAKELGFPEIYVERLNQLYATLPLSSHE